MRRNRTAVAVGMVVGLLLAGPVPTAPARPARAATWETLIPGSAFQDRDALMAEWNFRYPWGSDHNGTARMYGSATDSNHVYLSPAGVLDLKATRITWDEGTSSSSPYLPIHYHSGVIHAKDQIVVNDPASDVGSSGSPGPTGDTIFKARNVTVGRSRNW